MREWYLPVAERRGYTWNIVPTSVYLGQFEAVVVRHSVVYRRIRKAVR